MNREQAKIIGHMSDETLSTLDRQDLIEKRDILGAIAEGIKVEFICPVTSDVKPVDKCLSYTRRCYRITTPKITFNGVEIDAPIKDAYSIADEGVVWALGFCSATCKLEPKPIGRNQAVYVLKGTMAGICWETYEACQLYCDTHNKMMGVGND